jgi:hypothetical protein
MNNRMKNQINRARKAGISNVDLMRMKEVAKKEAKKMESDAVEKAFLYMLAIPLNVLVHDYWSKTAKKKAPKFIEDVISLYESVQAGVVTDEELAGLLNELAGVNVEAEWLKKR